jgi:transglutaminase-like putative cysteine protease
MYYQIQHVTAYRYSEPISESLMELRMQPRTEGPQRCWDFQVRTTPRAHIGSFRDALDNTVHHFDIPGRHDQLTIAVEALVEMDPPAPHAEALGAGAWEELAVLSQSEDIWEMLRPSSFARPTDSLRAFASALGLERLADPLTTMHALARAVHGAIAYAPKSTRVDSPIDEVLAQRRGVCQDFAHILIALARDAGIPCRYVSGYLFHVADDPPGAGADATHAWVESLVPGYGWLGFDPTNNQVAGERHIRAAIGRDYADVPPTRGVFKGDAQTDSALHVAVRVAPSAAPLPAEVLPPVTWAPVHDQQ